MLDLAFRDQVFDRAGDVLNRHLGIDAVLVEKVDDVRPEALERLLGDLPDALWAAVETRLGVAVLEPKLGADDHPVTEGRDGFADDFFVHCAIGFGGVEEGHTTFKCRSNEANGLCRFDGGTKPEGQAHTTEAEG